MNPNPHVLVYGAYGHTGRFVVTELLRRGLVPVLSGRDRNRLADQARRFPALETRRAAVDDGPALEAALRGVAAVVNCAGPFLDTGLPVAAAAVRSGVHYVDVTAEQAAVQDLYRAYPDTGRPLDVTVLPGMAFYGGLGDLLATAALAEWDAADEITVAIGLDRWWPTEGTRRTGRRNTATRLVVEGGRLVPVPGRPPLRDWDFPEPLGTRPVTGTPFSEIITMSRHLNATRIGTYLTTASLDDLRDPATPAPRPADASGHSAQRFVVDVVARRGQETRRAVASGRDIYAVTAPLAVEAVQRVLDGRVKTRGVAAPGEMFEAVDFLDSLGEVSWSRG